METSDNEPYYSDGGKATLARFLLNKARPELFREVTSLERPTFNALVTTTRCGKLLLNTIVDCLLYKGMPCHSQLHYIMHNMCADEFGPRYFHDVLDALVSLYPKYVNLNSTGGTPERLLDPKYEPFKKCLGALAGVFIPATIPADQQAPYRNRKGFIAQNVLAVVNFNFEFVYLLAGWEGSAHDGTVLADTFQKDFVIPHGKFYLADAGYGLQKGILTPFRAVRYHLKEQARAGLRPANPKELYNLRHASTTGMPHPAPSTHSARVL
ncbi:hypothetical protein PSTG_17173 [Puccinia striiformis f. sp. tritici PST-78]|uniref:DDE Tnp4 domain-containing protein n=1 Tax=Puccinia striiformis f. sp. tritici PST-78 TaxID=1165861 RepID=A0A0L0UQW7_9BASI|nr:hypothetical protein PSTG_17173 [Puccinia striiformis f. sp. tritici PST-78]